MAQITKKVEIMVLAPVTILGGLPVVADVWFTRGDGYTSDDDAGVSHLYWHTKHSYDNPTKHGKEVSQTIYDKVEKEDYWESDVIEQASDWLAYKDWVEKHPELNVKLGD